MVTQRIVAPEYFLFSSLTPLLFLPFFQPNHPGSTVLPPQCWAVWDSGLL